MTRVCLVALLLRTFVDGGPACTLSEYGDDKGEGVRRRELAIECWWRESLEEDVAKVRTRKGKEKERGGEKRREERKAERVRSGSFLNMSCSGDHNHFGTEKHRPLLALLGPYTPLRPLHSTPLHSLALLLPVSLDLDSRFCC